MFTYPAIIKPDGSTLSISFRDIPEAITFGETQSEALKHGRDAMETALTFYIEKEIPFPIPSKLETGEFLIQASIKACIKFKTYEIKLNIRKFLGLLKSY